MGELHLWWGEAPEEPDDSTKGNPQKRQRPMSKATRRAEPWPTIDHGSARLTA